MTHLHRVIVAWSGPQVVGTAVNVLHFSASDPSAPPTAAIRAAYNGLADTLPTGVQIVVPSTGDTIDDTNGSLVGVWTGAAGSAVTGRGDAKAAAGVGACVGWNTGGIVTGPSGKAHKLRGRTFIVPLAPASYDLDGTLNDGCLGLLTGFANALQAAGPLAVWHRPTTKGGSDGNSYGVISNRVRDKVAFLSSRRD